MNFMKKLIVLILITGIFTPNVSIASSNVSIGKTPSPKYVFNYFMNHPLNSFVTALEISSIISACKTILFSKTICKEHNTNEKDTAKHLYPGNFVTQGLLTLALECWLFKRTVLTIKTEFMCNTIPQCFMLSPKTCTFVKLPFYQKTGSCAFHSVYNAHRLINYNGDLGTLEDFCAFWGIKNIAAEGTLNPYNASEVFAAHLFPHPKTLIKNEFQHLYMNTNNDNKHLSIALNHLKEGFMSFEVMPTIQMCNSMDKVSFKTAEAILEAIMNNNENYYENSNRFNSGLPIVVRITTHKIWGDVAHAFVVRMTPIIENGKAVSAHAEVFDSNEHTNDINTHYKTVIENNVKFLTWMLCNRPSIKAESINKTEAPEPLSLATA